MRALTVAIVCGLVGAGCRKHEPALPSAPAGEKKPRVELTVWLDPTGGPAARDGTAISLSTAALPKTPQLVKREGIAIGVIGVPKNLALREAIEYLGNTIYEIRVAGSDATVVLGVDCLKDLAPAIQRNRELWWTVALVVGNPCGGRVTSPIGVTALVETGQASRVRLTFDRNTRALLKVEPLR